MYKVIERVITMYKMLKRFADITVSLIGIIILLPLFLFVALCILLESRGGVFFVQERLGYKGKVFKMIKFRSMVSGAEKYGVYESKSDNRITKVGKIIRKTSIDELPQLFNVIKGDMSLVGPRPTLTYHPWEFSSYTDKQRRRFLMKPGITGYAQVNGRKQLDWEERIKLDVFYVDNLSLLVDLVILLKTVIVVISSKENVNEGETVKK